MEGPSKKLQPSGMVAWHACMCLNHSLPPYPPPPANSLFLANNFSSGKGEEERGRERRGERREKEEEEEGGLPHAMCFQLEVSLLATPSPPPLIIFLVVSGLAWVCPFFLEKKSFTHTFCTPSPTFACLPFCLPAFPWTDNYHHYLLPSYLGVEEEDISIYLLTHTHMPVPFFPCLPLPRIFALCVVLSLWGGGGRGKGDLLPRQTVAEKENRKNTFPATTLSSPILSLNNGCDMPLYLVYCPCPWLPHPNHTPPYFATLPASSPPYLSLPNTFSELIVFTTPFPFFGGTAHTPGAHTRFLPLPLPFPPPACLSLSSHLCH